jgi:hypothetical protein
MSFLYIGKHKTYLSFAAQVEDKDVNEHMVPERPSAVFVCSYLTAL